LAIYQLRLSGTIFTGPIIGEQAASAQLRDQLAQAEQALRRMRVVTKSIGLVRRLDGLRAENVELKLRFAELTSPSLSSLNTIYHHCKM